MMGKSNLKLLKTQYHFLYLVLQVLKEVKLATADGDAHSCLFLIT